LNHDLPLVLSSAVRRSGNDPARDRAVMHTGNAVSFEEIVATLDQSWLWSAPSKERRRCDAPCSR
jgi:hypothetical protein